MLFSKNEPIQKFNLYYKRQVHLDAIQLLTKCGRNAPTTNIILIFNAIFSSKQQKQNFISISNAKLDNNFLSENGMIYWPK